MPSFTFAASAFANALPAGPVFADAGHRALTKAAIGLGLGLPIEILHTSLASKSAVGLGIYIADFDLGGDLVSPMTSDSTGTSTSYGSSPMQSPTKPSSPPLMATRRTPRRMPLVPSPDFDDEYAPMRTPSPSLRGDAQTTPPMLFAFAVPNVPDLSLIGASDGEEYGGEEQFAMLSCSAATQTTLPSTESISSGLDLLTLSDEEMWAYVPSMLLDEEEDKPMYPSGLGLSLADMEGPELVFTLREHGFLPTEDDDCYPMSSSASAAYFASYGYKPASPRSPLAKRFLEQEHVAQPKSSHAKLSLGFSVESGGNEMAADDGPTLGFTSSGFWGEVSALLHGEP